MNLEKAALSKLVLGLCSQTQTHPTEPQDSNTIRPNQIMRKLDTLERINKKTEQTRMLFGPNREYTVAEYLSTVTDPNVRKALTMYRLSEYSLAIEKLRRRQTWLS
jgi:hypothetical protein